jgi:tRNA pseudouridine55 synthase
MISTVQERSIMDGVLVIKKEAGWTSHDVVAKIRQLLGGSKVGHGGTLDPAATGVLPVLIGKGTRIAEYLVEWDKEYRAVLRLGETTDTQDATGSVLVRHATEDVASSAIHAVVERFRGPLEQVPPMFSAVKVGGVPLYKSARAGKTITRKARTIVIHALDILAIDGRDVTLRVVCSKGTYIRTLCADIGGALGVGGHLSALERCRVGPLAIDQAVTVDEVESRQALGRLGDDVLSLDQALQGIPALIVDDQTAVRVRHGAPVPFSKILRWESVGGAEPKPGQPLRIHDTDGRLLAIGRHQPTSVAIEKMLIGQE